MEDLFTRITIGDEDGESIYLNVSKIIAIREKVVEGKIHTHLFIEGFNDPIYLEESPCRVFFHLIAGQRGSKKTSESLGMLEKLGDEAWERAHPTYIYDAWKAEAGEE
jgi:hypothetical protein